MAHPATRQQLIDWALRNLGDDVIEINVSDEQLEDRLDEALEYFWQFHYDGQEKIYLKHQVVASSVNLTTASGDTFTLGETIESSSGGIFKLVSVSDDKFTLYFTRWSGTLAPDDTITGLTSAAIATLTSNAEDIVSGDIQNGWIPVDDNIHGINRVIPFNQSWSGSQFNMFDVRYQLMLNDMYSLTNVSMLYYTQVQSHLTMINFFLNPETTFQFSRYQGRLHLNIDWVERVRIGDWLIIEAQGVLDPDTWTKVYNDRMLKEYYTALVKKQWGNNLKKFEGMQMPGGVTFNGQKIFDEAVEEIKELKAEFQSTYQLPVDFLIG